MTPLDHPQWAALTTAHAPLARRQGAAATYPFDIMTMSGVADPDDPAAWADLAALLGAGGRTGLMLPRPPSLPGFIRPLRQRWIVQMLGPETPPEPPAPPEGVAALGLADGAKMVDLATRTEPGPMQPRTVTAGAYWGVRVGGALAAMAGERMRLPDHVEISGVCTDPPHRGQGFARYLVARLLWDAARRGQRGFLHVKTENAAARALYDSMGFTVRAQIHLNVIEVAGLP